MFIRQCYSVAIAGVGKARMNCIETIMCDCYFIGKGVCIYVLRKLPSIRKYKYIFFNIMAFSYIFFNTRAFSVICIIFGKV